MDRTLSLLGKKKKVEGGDGGPPDLPPKMSDPDSAPPLPSKGGANDAASASSKGPGTPQSSEQHTLAVPAMGTLRKRLSMSEKKAPLVAHHPVASEKMPEKDKLNKIFEGLMENLGMEESQRKGMRAMPDEAKWKLILSSKSRVEQQTQTDSETKQKGTPDYFIDKLRHRKAGPKHLTTLKVFLTTREISWLVAFLKMDGMRYMFETMSEIDKREPKKRDDHELLHELVRCLRAIANTKHGIKALLGDPTAFNILVLSMDSCGNSDKKIILEVLTAMCYMDRINGHGRVVKGTFE
jgi:hypothetical protein